MVNETSHDYQPLYVFIKMMFGLLLTLLYSSKFMSYNNAPLKRYFFVNR